MLLKEAVSSRILELLEKLMNVDDFKAFRLVGGTALALQLGHRESVDIDLFSYQNFQKDLLTTALENNFAGLSRLEIGEKSLRFYYNFIKVDFWALSHPFIRPQITEQNIRMASLEDIAAMKLDTITARATKKDYYDIAELLNRYTFKDLIGFYSEKYPHMSTRNVIDVIRDIPIRNFDLEKTNPPKTLKAISWKEVKNKIFSAFDEFRNEELNKKIEEMNKRRTAP